MKARERILARVRRALSGRPEAALPPVPEGVALSKEEAFELFKTRLSAAGARVERLSSLEEARAFLQEAEAGAKTAWVSLLVPETLRPELPEAPPEEAELGVSRATAGVAETGSVVLSSREGRRGQLLVPRHLVWLFEDDLYGTLLLALRSVRGEDASALALHSGPSKSADIGQIMVKGVHGPGELWVGVLAFQLDKDEDDFRASSKNGRKGENGMRGIDWERVQSLEGQDLLTKNRKKFKVIEVTSTAVLVKPHDSPDENEPHRVLRKYLDQAVEALNQGEKISGPEDYKKKIYPNAPSYAWAILHELGYV